MPTKRCLPDVLYNRIRQLPATPKGVGHSLGTGGNVRAYTERLKYASMVAYSKLELYTGGMSRKLDRSVNIKKENKFLPTKYLLVCGFVVNYL